MICPVISNPVYSKFHDHATVLVDCKGVACAWWFKEDENCIIFPITKSLMDLADVIARSGISPARPETPQPKEKEPAHDLSVPEPTSHT